MNLQEHWKDGEDVSGDSCL